MRLPPGLTPTLRLAGIKVSVLTAGRRVIVNVDVSGSATPLIESTLVIVTCTVTGVGGGLPEGAVRVNGTVTSAPVPSVAIG